MITLTIETPDAMAELGRRIARQLRAGDVVALDGELGAGKTTLTRGLGAELGVRGTVTSPTFVLARTHPRAPGEPPLVHVDAYRLSTPAELDDLDLDVSGSIVVIEWAVGMIDGLSDSVLHVTIDRPTGGAVTGAGSEAGSAAGGVGDEPPAHEPVDPRTDPDAEQIEPRRVAIREEGPRWAADPFV